MIPYIESKRNDNFLWEITTNINNEGSDLTRFYTEENIIEHIFEFKTQIRYGFRRFCNQRHIDDGRGDRNEKMLRSAKRLR